MTPAVLTGLLAVVTTQTYAVEQLASSGPPSNRIDIAILGDGYRDLDQAQLSADARALVQSLLATPPFGEYERAFNFSVIHVISAQQGADNGAWGPDRDTALGAHYGCYGIDRLICLDTVNALTIAAQHVPGYDLALVIVNDTMYGGAGGAVAVTSINPAAHEVVRHEIGHTIAGLADEYEDPYPGYPACDPVNDCREPNVTLRQSRELIKWSAWLDPDIAVPTPERSEYYERYQVGVFEGARYQTSGVFRPMVYGCKMRSLVGEVCPVCREALIRSVYRRVDPLDSLRPAKEFTAAACEPISFSVTTVVPAERHLFSWKVDGAQVPSAGRAIGASRRFPRSPGAVTVSMKLKRLNDAPLTIRLLGNGTESLRLRLRSGVLEALNASNRFVFAQNAPVGPWFDLEFTFDPRRKQLTVAGGQQIPLRSAVQAVDSLEFRTEVSPPGAHVLIDNVLVTP